MISDEDLSLDNSIEFQGLVQQIKCNNYLMPLYEAVINSIQSIQINRIKNGKIDIYIERNNEVQQKLSDEFKGKIEPIKNIYITDNGIGFNDENFKHFKRVFTTHKKKYGCKGIGRVLWLKAFREVKVDSSYKKNRQFYNRKFTYKLPSGIEAESYINKKSKSKSNSTTIKLIGLKNEYLNESNQKIETIAQRIIEHCFEYFVGKSTIPEITISGYDDPRTEKIIQLNLNDMFLKIFHGNVEEENIKIKNKTFSLKHVKMFDSSEASNHRIFYCANSRAVFSETLKSITQLANLENKIIDKSTGEKFYYNVYLSGNYFDEKVDYVRDSFDIIKHLDNPPRNILTFDEIKNKIVKSIKKYIEPYLEIVKTEKRKYIEKVVKNKLPQYNYILQESDDFFDDISPSIKENNLVDKIRLKHFQKKEILDNEYHAILIEKKKHGIKETPEYKERLKKFKEELLAINNADLSEYILHRKIIIDLFETYLSWKEDKSYYKEDAIHDLIYPKGFSSDEVSYENHNLWIIDDRLSFQDFIASDIPLSSNKDLSIPDNKRPDIFFDNKYIFSNDSKKVTFDSITLIEFKRPLRDDYTSEENPIEQTYSYINKIKDKKLLTEKGRPVNVEDNTRFYIYIICDITPSLEKLLKTHDFNKTVDPGGYYKIHGTYNAYIEIISLDKLLSDSKKRNAILFEKLGLK